MGLGYYKVISKFVLSLGIGVQTGLNYLNFIDCLTRAMWIEWFTCGFV